jgi:hypothetical protein
MPSSDTSCASRDILSRPLLTFLFYVLPSIAIIITAMPRFTFGLRAAVWTIALAVMGVACVTNAFRCRRTHCHITGPFFLLMALISLLYGLHILPLGRNAWGLIGLAILAGAIVFCCLPEMFLGKYRQARADNTGNGR